MAVKIISCYFFHRWTAKLFLQYGRLVRLPCIFQIAKIVMLTFLLPFFRRQICRKSIKIWRFQKNENQVTLICFTLNEKIWKLNHLFNQGIKNFNDILPISLSINFPNLNNFQPLATGSGWLSNLNKTYSEVVQKP